MHSEWNNFLNLCFHRNVDTCLRTKILSIRRIPTILKRTISDIPCFIISFMIIIISTNQPRTQYVCMYIPVEQERGNSILLNERMLASPVLSMYVCVCVYFVFLTITHAYRRRRKSFPLLKVQ